MEGFQQAQTVTKVMSKKMPPMERMIYRELRPAKFKRRKQVDIVHLSSLSLKKKKTCSETPNYSVDKVQIKETSNGRLIAQVARNTKCKNEWGNLGTFFKG